MDNYKSMENNSIINYSAIENMQSSLSGLVDVLADYQKQMQEISFGYLQDTLSDFAQQMTQICFDTIDFGVFHSAIEQIIETNIFPLVDHEIISSALSDSIQALGNSFYGSEGLQVFSENYSQIFAGYADIFSQISDISTDDMETLLDGTGFTRDDVLEDIKQFGETVVELKNPDKIEENNEIYIQKVINDFLKKHPAIAHVLYCLRIVIAIASGVQVTQDMLLPLAQNAIVSLQGCEDIFFIKVDSAKLYTAPDSHSDVITKVLYAEQVTQIDSVKQWNKVIYINSDGEEITGWIAKRNLMTYLDYEFNSDDLYNIE